MNKKHILIILGVLMMFSLFGCKKKYNVDYDGMKDSYKNAKSSYAAGTKVEIYYDCIGTDTDYSFYLDGQSLSYSYSDSKGFIISFTMPEHDVKLTMSAKNSMEYVQEEDLITYQETVYSEEGNQSYIINIRNEDGWIIERYETFNSVRENYKDYPITQQQVDELLNLIADQGFSEWPYLKEWDCLEGKYIEVSYHKDGIFYSVDSGRMPSDGSNKLSAVKSALQELLKKTSENQ